MAVSRVSTSSIAQGFPKSRSLLAGNDWSATWLIQRQTLATASSTITFSNIPQGYKHLQIRGITRQATAGNSDQYMRFNSTSTGYYAAHTLGGDGTSAYSNVDSTTTDIKAIYSIGSATGTSTTLGGFVIDILDYTNTNKYKTTRTFCGWDSNGSGYVMLRSGLWMNTAAITSIAFFASSGNIAQYSSFALYGVL